MRLEGAVVKISLFCLIFPTCVARERGCPGRYPTFPSCAWAQTAREHRKILPLT